METLNNYITERIRVDNIKRPEFPINGTLDDVVKFLKEQGFKEIKDLPYFTLYTNYVVPFNKYKDKCFAIEVDGTNTGIIYFADTSKDKISKSNILYIIRLYPATHEMIVRKIWGDGGNMYVFLDKGEFKKEMESYFV